MSVAKKDDRKKVFHKGNLMLIPYIFNHERILCFSGSLANQRATQYVAWGVVKKIEKGKDFDVVTMSFGKDFGRRVIVQDNFARRQIYTLKHNQIAQVVGELQYYRTQDEETQKMVSRAQLYAKGFLAFYTPRSMDVIKIEQNEEDDVEKIRDDLQDQMAYIDALIKGGQQE